MKWSSKVSDSTDFEKGIRECLTAIKVDLDAQPDLVIAFVSPDFAPVYRDLPGLIYEYFPETIIVGCSGNGVIGNV